MTAKHTPGPWSSYPCNLEAYSRVITAKGAMVQIAHTGVREKIAMTKEVYGDRMTYEAGDETTANARLIVAAPTLLEVLQELEESSAYWSEYDVPLGIVERIKAAIELATGGAA